MTPSITEQIDRAAGLFRKRFHRAPRFAAVAPGRVNLIGEHTDYNDGFVLPMAIERQTVIVADKAPGTQATVASTSDATEAGFAVDDRLKPGTPAWANYVKGVVFGCVQRDMNPGGFDAMVDSTVPLGGGLSSSASLEVATATLIEAMTNKTLNPVEKALLAQKAEHNFAGMPCGIMDQFISVMAKAGHAMLLDCRSHVTTMVPVSDPGICVLIANTNVKHELTGSEYPQRRRQCEQAAKILGVQSLRDATMAQLESRRAGFDPVVYNRASHIISEIQRTAEAAQLAGKNDWTGFGKLMYESHRTLRDLFEVSCAELDVMVDLASELGLAKGVFGSRMTGGGFGGCTVSLVRSDSVEAVKQHLHEAYRKRTGIEPTIFATRPAAGARIVPI